MSSAFVKSLGKLASGERILTPHLDNWFARGIFPEEIHFFINPNKEEDTAFHPSSSTLCARVLYALREKDHTPVKHTAENYKTFMFGHYIHSLVYYILGPAALGLVAPEDIEREFYFSHGPKATHEGMYTDAGNPFDVRGFVDIAKCVVPNKGEFLVDVKTVNAKQFSMESLPAYTWDKYEAQVRLYLDFTGIDTAILLCAEKDTPHRFKEYLIHRDDQHVDEIVAKWESVVDAQVAGVPPACTCDPARCPVKEVYDIALSGS